MTKWERVGFALGITAAILFWVAIITAAILVLFYHSYGFAVVLILWFAWRTWLNTSWLKLKYRENNQPPVINISSSSTAKEIAELLTAYVRNSRE